MSWKIFDSGIKSASENMQLDSSLLEELEQPLLHFYEWEKDSVTYGHFIQPDEFLNLEELKKEGFEWAKRPTGGGIVFHNCDLAFSALVPASHEGFSSNTLENYSFINNKTKRAIEKFTSLSLDFLQHEEAPLDSHCRNFCMAKPTKYDVMLGGKKVGGAAQRVTKLGYLHQGSILLGALSEDFLQRVLKPHSKVATSMKNNSHPLLGREWNKKNLQEARVEMKRLILQTFTEES